MRTSTILTIVGASAFISAGALGTAAVLAQNAPTKTVTIDLKNGEQGIPGPQGPQGPKGDPGGTTCPDGYVFGKLIINHPGGHAEIFTCMTPDSD